MRITRDGGTLRWGVGEAFRAIAPSKFGLTHPSTLVYRGMQTIERKPVDEAAGLPAVIQ
ncbi:MAG TPA: hypothetical protein V6C65_28750 [Allocoleopsis sp.]